MKGRTNSSVMVHWRLCTISLLLISLLTWPMAGGVTTAVAATPTTFSGSATVVNANVLGVNQQLGATNVYPSGSSAFSDERSLLDVAITGLLTAEVGHASTIGKGNVSRSQSSLADLNLTVAGNTIGASFLSARAMAVCGPGGPSVSGSSEIADLTINGKSIAVTGEPNQTVDLPGGGQVIINEQSGTSNEINVTALHVIIPGVADVAIASVHADITCGQALDCPGQHAFVTAGGYINWPAGSDGKAHFAVAGRNASYWGHVLYRDSLSSVHIQNPYAVVYNNFATLTADANAFKYFHKYVDQNQFDAGKFQGAAILTWYDSNGAPAGQVLVIDMGEPGRADFFEIVSASVLTMGELGTGDAGGFLAGGNVQMHGKCL
jgi:hypothetical protein